MKKKKSIQEVFFFWKLIFGLLTWSRCWWKIFKTSSTGRSWTSTSNRWTTRWCVCVDSAGRTYVASCRRSFHAVTWGTSLPSSTAASTSSSTSSKANNITISNFTASSRDSPVSPPPLLYHLFIIIFYSLLFIIIIIRARIYMHL